MFEIKVISDPINDLPGPCECRGYAGTSNNMTEEPWLPSLPEDRIQL